MIDDIKKALIKKFPAELINKLISRYLTSLKEYRRKDWISTCTCVGQFIEISMRMVNYALTKKYKDLNENLPALNEQLLNKWENYSKEENSESYRIIIPRVLFAMYCIRSKRGVHVKKADPGIMDATLLINDMKWVLAEFFRLAVNMPSDKVYNIINSIVSKEPDLIWNINGRNRVLDNTFITQDQILLILYENTTLTDKELLKDIEYSNPSKFREILAALHRKRLLEYNKNTGECTISPTGERNIEKKISKLNL
ncbi:hypothetical protein [Lactobacillus sp. wkB10]|uniref:hypothetical protein n=1 Tax=Lactobacillus sp. wkB10 TaxID=1545701 RepID=UPI000512E43E|nr:hypothetical protein [Lactobacillus sp. wkB10]KGG54586.1 hypothetical protein LACWKB10_0542 [Lactobacillus sp. wkB10]